MNSLREKHSILYIDDEQSNLDIFRISFKREYNIFTAYEPEQAFEILKNNQIDIIIADQQMPQMTGTQFLEKTLQEYPEAIRIILTGYADIQVVIEAINKCGIYKYITKPWEREDIKMTLEKAVETVKIKRENQWLVQSLEQELTKLEAKYFEQYKEAREYARKLEKQKAEISAMYRKLGQNINYASKIQNALLPKDKTLLEFFQDFFEINAPLDVVSGDFYWFHQVSDFEAYLAIVDCTGHGIAGALMSVIGHTELNKAIKERRIREPKDILEVIHQDLSNSLFSNETSDGMDVALCRFQKTSPFHYRMTFAGARRPLYILQNSIILEVPGSRKSVGGLQIYAEGKYEQHSLHLESGNQLYLFTDGVPDIANDNRQKFGLKRLKDLILRTYQLPAEEQKLQIMQEVAEFKQDTAQRDDFLMLSVRL
ncbi:SpoIIE family protein phosphatase [Raineya orbicola]|jgi:serine phosphatase RsbU (regulator of sigma subunit)|uniref:Response regulator receiver domain n=1 Tax=Raineya orbicola TaxID=2016530 RepID=A0A2N3HZZ0_9BACT|nr:SpoIIE family protein phosphatase [Raineya orbicola]PKQ63622.1 Response regulator receiver domain [Raineya orbicola]